MRYLSLVFIFCATSLSMRASFSRFRLRFIGRLMHLCYCYSSVNVDVQGKIGIRNKFHFLSFPKVDLQIFNKVKINLSKCFHSMHLQMLH